MTKDERLLKRALDVLDWAHDVFGLEKDGIAIKTALRERLAQPEQCQYPQCQCATESPCLKGLAQPEQEPAQRTWAGSGDIEDSNAYLAAEREKVAAWMMQRSYATGHGDTIEDLIKELEWQVAEREREECAQLCETKHFSSPVREFGAKDCAVAIRARGNK